MKDGLSNNEYRDQKIENMKKLVSLGYPAYGKAFKRTNRLDKLHDLFSRTRAIRRSIIDAGQD